MGCKSNYTPEDKEVLNSANRENMISIYSTDPKQLLSAFKVSTTVARPKGPHAFCLTVAAKIQQGEKHGDPGKKHTEYFRDNSENSRDLLYLEESKI